MTKMVKVMLEVSDDLSDDDLFECLCKAIHEQNLDDLEVLNASISNIVLPDSVHKDLT